MSSESHHYVKLSNYYNCSHYLHETSISYFGRVTLGLVAWRSGSRVGEWGDQEITCGGYSHPPFIPSFDLFDRPIDWDDHRLGLSSDKAYLLAQLIDILLGVFHI